MYTSVLPDRWHHFRLILFGPTVAEISLRGVKNRTQNHAETRSRRGETISSDEGMDVIPDERSGRYDSCRRQRHDIHGDDLCVVSNEMTILYESLTESKLLAMNCRKDPNCSSRSETKCVR